MHAIHNCTLHPGPGIGVDKTWAEPATQVDLAPTWLGIAGLKKPATMDGKSLLPLLVSPEAAAEAADPTQPSSLIAESTARHLRELGSSSDYAANWRDAVFIEVTK